MEKDSLCLSFLFPLLQALSLLFLSPHPAAPSYEAQTIAFDSAS